MKKILTFITIWIFLFSVNASGVSASFIKLQSGGGAEVSDPAQLKSLIMPFYQENIESMNESEFSFQFSVSGESNVESFIKLDSYGEIDSSEPLDSNKVPLMQWFMEQLGSMSSGNYNAYARLAIKEGLGTISLGYSISYNPSLTEISVNVRVNVEWSDAEISGITALQARDAVISHAQAFLDSPLYPYSGSHDEKLKAINKYICETFQYDYRLFTEDEADDVIYTAYRMITDSEGIGGYPRGVCQAYAMYGFIVLKLAGYDSITIDGQVPSIENPQDFQNHVWNMVKVYDKWYHIDFTWNDPVSNNNPLPYIIRQSGPGIVSFDYFMKSDTDIANDHTWPTETDGYTYPIANSVWDANAPTPIPTATPYPSGTSSGEMSLSDVISSSIDSGDTGSSVSANQSSAQSTAFSSEDPGIIIYSSASIVSEVEPSYEKNDPKVSISGTLTDSTGNPLGGAKMVLYATNQTVTTDNDGNYTFNDVKVGSYKIQIYDENNEMISELPIIITFGDQTVQSNGSVTVKGGRLEMDLMLNNGVLSIRQVSSPAFELTTTTMILVLLAVILIAGAIIIPLIRKSRNVNDQTDI